jgi:hypothetical protein
MTVEARKTKKAPTMWVAQVSIRNNHYWLKEVRTNASGTRADIAAARAVLKVMRTLPPRTQVKGVAVKLERLAPIKQQPTDSVDAEGS